MIKTEYYMTRPDGVRLFRTYSDERYRIIQNDTGNVYDEAVDVEGTAHTYSESEEPIEDTTSDTEALNIILGRDVNDEG